MTNGSKFPDQVDVAVIGGGLAGLTAATAAARHGATVALLDGRSVGGRARSTERDGYVLNEGGHALYESIGGRAVLDRLGVHVTGRSPDVAGYRLLWDGEIVPFPSDPRSVLRSPILGARSKLLLGRWFASIGELARSAGDTAVDEWLDDQRARPDLRKFLLALLRLTTYSARPEDAPVWAMLGQIASSAGGAVRYVDGGWQTIVDGLVASARAAGVALADHEPAVHVASEHGRWSVSTTGPTLDAGSIVFAAGGPAAATALLGGDDAGWVERAGPVQRAACLDVGCAEIGQSFLLSADGPLYLSAHAPVAALAPPGRRLYSVMRYLHADDRSTSAENRAALEQHAERAGLPGPADRDLQRFLAAPTVAWGSPQVGVVRPTGFELADRGVFAAGDWVGRHLLSDAALTSGEAAGVAAARRAMVAA